MRWEPGLNGTIIAPLDAIPTDGVDVMTTPRYIITGSASGIGRSTARLAAEAGAAVCLVDLDGEALSITADQLRAAGHQVETITADLSEPDSPAQVIEEAAEALGGIDALVSNAGAPAVGSLLELTTDRFDFAIAVNTRAHWLLAKAAHPWLAQSRGAIVTTGSLTGWHPSPPLGAYSTAKAAQMMLVKQMALEWGPDGIRCNSVSPGPTMTRMTDGIFNDDDDPRQREMRLRREAHIPLRKVGTADEVANAVMFLAGPLASQITGIDILVDGGLHLSLMPAVGGGAGREIATSYGDN